MNENLGAESVFSESWSRDKQTPMLTSVYLTWQPAACMHASHSLRFCGESVVKSITLTSHLLVNCCRVNFVKSSPPKAAFESCQHGWRKNTPNPRKHASKLPFRSVYFIFSQRGPSSLFSPLISTSSFIRLSPRAAPI